MNGYVKRKKTLQKVVLFRKKIIEQKKHKSLMDFFFLHSRLCCPALSQASKNCSSIIHNLLNNYCSFWGKIVKKHFFPLVDFDYTVDLSDEPETGKETNSSYNIIKLR